MSKSSIIALSLGIISIISVVAYIAYDMNKRRDTVTLAKGATIPARSPETVSPFGDAAGTPSSAPLAEPETINGIIVPPMPDEVLNNSTVAGIDSNTNGVRDDIERLVAEEFGNSSLYQEVMDYEKSLQRALLSPSTSNALENNKRLACFSAKERLLELSDITKKLVNTVNRMRAYTDAFPGITASIDPCSEYSR